MSPSPSPSSRRGRRLLVAALSMSLAGTGLVAATGDAAPASTQAARSSQADVPEGATWYETFLDTPDGERLHADVMRPAGIADDVRTPVILVVSPYLGMTSPTEQPGPSDRFFDFFVGADVWSRGYTVVQVSTRGTGGSSGCLDILGPGEQTDIVTAVEWAASQPWSTGKVGMYGKSYDANTGAAALALQPEGLAAVVAQQIAPDRYDGSYSDGVRLLQSLAYPSVSYGSQGEGAFSVNGDPEYAVNSASRSADCQALLAEHYVDDPSIGFWRVRDFVDRADESTVPAFITTGYLDNATNIGAGAVDLFDTLEGPKRLWIGWWDHVRGNDTSGDTLAMGREGFFDEVMRFYDHFVKGVPETDAPWHLDPIVAAQDNTGYWRSETAFPPADVVEFEAPLLEGTYVDDGRNLGSADGGTGAGGVGSPRGTVTGEGAWTFSEPLPYPVHLAGIPTASLDLEVLLPRTNVAVNVYDVDESGRATMITRGAALVQASGEKDVKLYPTDWLFEPGHRIGVLVSGANAEAWIHVPTDREVTVLGGTVRLPVLPTARTSDLEGDPAIRLDAYLGAAPFDVSGLIDDRTSADFGMPDRQR